MQEPGADLEYGTEPGASRLDGKDFFSFSPIRGKKSLQNSLKCQGPHAM